jgi:mRNA-degrading endonuclease RelE of RelBE toxin-antitoxin system
MVTFVFTKPAEKDFAKLSKDVRARMIAKLKEFKNHDDILFVLKRLIDFEPATHRLRIGNFRLILKLNSQEGKNFVFWILNIGHRKDIYK